MSESKTSERRIEAAEKKRQALELRKAGATYAAIAAALGYESTSSAYKAVMTAIRAIYREPAEEVRELEIARCDEMLRALWPGVMAGDAKKVNAALRVMERRSKYLGLDAPQKVDVRHMIEELAREAGLSEEDTAAAVAEAERIARNRE